MLAVAKNYEQELTKMIRNTWYDLNYQYFWSGACCDLDFPSEDYYKRSFAYIEDDEIKGYFAYSMDRSSKSIHHFGLMSFGGHSIKFMNEVIAHIEWLLNEKIVDRVEFFAYEDNPVMRSYKRMVKRFGGKQVGKLTNVSRLYDGKLHSSIIFEILREDYEKTDRYLKKSGGKA